MMTRTVLIGLACLAAACGGCATSVTTYEPGVARDPSASPASTGSAPLPGNVFGPSTHHDFGSGGP